MTAVIAVLAAGGGYAFARVTASSPAPAVSPAAASSRAAPATGGGGLGMPMGGGGGSAGFSSSSLAQSIGKQAGTAIAGLAPQTLSLAQARTLGTQVPAGASVDKASNTITFTANSVSFTVVAVPPGGPDMTFRVAGLTNPAIVVPHGAQVTVRFINGDSDEAHAWMIVNEQPPFSFYQPKTPAISGAFSGLIGDPTASGQGASTFTFQAGPAWHIPVHMSHAWPRPDGHARPVHCPLTQGTLMTDIRYEPTPPPVSAAATRVVLIGAPSPLRAAVAHQVRTSHAPVACLDAPGQLAPAVSSGAIGAGRGLTGATVVFVTVPRPPGLPSRLRHRFGALAVTAGFEQDAITARQHGVTRVVVLSTVFCSGDDRGRGLDPGSPALAAAETAPAVAAEQAALTFTSLGGDSVVLRLGWTWSPEEAITRRVMSAAKRGWRLIDGDPGAWVAMIAEPDAARAVLPAITIRPGS